MLVVLVVLLGVSFGSATPWPFPGRPLESQHKKMRVNIGEVQSQGQLLASTAGAQTSSFTVRRLLCCLVLWFWSICCCWLKLLLRLRVEALVHVRDSIPHFLLVRSMSFSG